MSHLRLAAQDGAVIEPEPAPWSDSIVDLDEKREAKRSEKHLHKVWAQANRVRDINAMLGPPDDCRAFAEARPDDFVALKNAAIDRLLRPILESMRSETEQAMRDAAKPR